ncbi:hypothetical protein [Thalassotalea atypica]|uniref:hypothetical protein n=1 Tax=Thalassotalea atypica TaxID=2054316 RepID=UPI002572B55A|nr:hypothetical protein [Thalassotalea atypica]
MEEKHIYRSKILISYGHVFVLFFILVILDNGIDISISAFIFASLLILIFTLIVIRFYKVTITDKYLTGYDYYGKYHSISWASIVSVKATRFGFLKYIKIESNDTKSVLWVPLFLDGFASFKVEALKRLENNNPLRKYLEK